MQAACYYGKHDIRIEDVPEPELLPGAVGIRSAFVGICGMPPAPLPGQVHPLTGERLPVTLGHEISGTVQSVGDGVTRMFHKVGGIPLEEAALIEPLTVAVHGVRRSGAQAGESALVVGAGPVGRLVGAVLNGIGLRVTMSEPGAATRSVAERCGVADVVLDPRLQDSRSQLGKSVPAGGGDVVFDCAASASAFDVALLVLKPKGILQLIAVYAHSPPVNLHRVAMKNQRSEAHSSTQETTPLQSRWFGRVLSTLLRSLARGSLFKTWCKESRIWQPRKPASRFLSTSRRRLLPVYSHEQVGHRALEETLEQEGNS